MSNTDELFNTVFERDAREVDGFCHLGYVDIFKKKSNYFGGFWSRFVTTPDSNNLISQAYYFNNASYPEKSPNLKVIKQNSGGSTPMVNTNLGAPLCTFVIGGITPDKTHPRAEYIKGASLTESFPDYINVQYKYKMSWEDSVDVVVPSKSDSAGAFPTIPINRFNNIKTSEEIPVLPTYNIWKIESPEINNIDYAEFMGPQGYVPVKQIWADNTFSLLVNALVVPRIQEEDERQEVVVKRVFPISYDLAYSNGSKLFYPSVNDANSTSKNIAIDQYQDNCGFQLHVEGSENTTTSGLNLGTIIVEWGDEDYVPSQESEKISKFKLELVQGQSPVLKIVKAKRENETTPEEVFFELNTSSPVFNDKISIFVHFAGPTMMLGFDSDPSNWNVIAPVELKGTGGLSEEDIRKTGESTHPYPFISNKATIKITVRDMAVKFQYGPIAFLNYDSNNPLLNCYWYTQLVVADDTNLTKTQIESSVNNYLSDHSLPKEANGVIIGKVEEKLYFEEKQNYISYYKDWRNIYTEQIKYSFIKENVSENFASKEPSRVLIGGIYYNTTIEGPIFLHLAHEPSAAIEEETPELITKIADLSTFLTGWQTSYSADSSSNLSFLTASAEVSLKNLEVDEFGAKALKAIRENKLVVSIGGGFGNENNIFFQGFIINERTKYDKSGSSTTLSCEDVATHILKNTRFPANYIFTGMRYIDILKSCLEMAGLQNWVDSSDLEKLPGATMVLGYSPAAASLANSEDYVDQSMFIYDMFIKILTYIVDGAGTIQDIDTPCFYWSVEKQKFILTTRKMQKEIDNLLFYGEDSESVPSDIHGLLTEGGYTIDTTGENVVNGYVAFSEDWTKKLILFGPRYYFPTSYPSLDNPILNYPYIGFKKYHLESLSDKGIFTDYALKTRSIRHYNTMLSRPTSKITFSTFVKRPLRPWGLFKIQTFIKGFGTNNAEDNTDNTFDSTDAYYYMRLSYNFDKNNNIIMADIEGMYQLGYNMIGESYGI